MPPVLLFEILCFVYCGGFEINVLRRVARMAGFAELG